MSSRQALLFGFAIAVAAVALMGVLNASDASDSIAVAAVSVFAVVVGTAIGAFVGRDEPRRQDPGQLGAVSSRSHTGA